MTIYKRVEIVDGETKEPVQFVALHPFAWPEDYIPTAAFVEDEDATARLTAADALFAASKDASKFFAKYVADTGSTLSKRALNRLERAMYEYEEAKE